jgi:hypothetical protein
MPETFWFNDPSVLFTPTGWSRFVPVKGMTTAEALNSTVRFTIYFSVLLTICSGVGGYILAIPVVMVTTVVLFRLFPNGSTIESFTLRKPTQSGSYTMPSGANPFMNVLLTDIKDNPNREDAAPVTRSDVKSEIFKAFQKTSDIYMDTSDAFDQSQAMRTFHTLQSSKVPNDQDGFLNWLAKGHDAPDHSSAPPARGGKILSEGFVAAKGSMTLPSSISMPSGSTPSGPLPK